jgi:hypothetical protein
MGRDILAREKEKEYGGYDGGKRGTCLAVLKLSSDSIPRSRSAVLNHILQPPTEAGS